MDSSCQDLSLNLKFEWKNSNTKKFQNDFYFSVFAAQHRTRHDREIEKVEMCTETLSH